MKPFEVGEWTVQPSLNRLTRGADEVRVEPKVMQVLEVLAETPGEVVTRDQLVARIWPDVFVTDDVLHRAIRELRKAFGDETAKPAYIETIRKRGYRLIARVGPSGERANGLTGQQANGLTGQQANGPTGQQAIRPSGHRASRIAIAASLGLAAILSAVVFALASRPTNDEAAPSSPRFVALTSSPLNEVDPAISPDGKQLAFAMRPDASDAGQAEIYVTSGAGQTPARLTSNPADDRFPSWSADGSMLAFTRIDGSTCDIILMSVADRRERKLAACGNIQEPRVSWSKNGDWLVQSFAPGPDPMRGWQIARVSTATGVRETLTLPTPGTLGDYAPSVSPDGSRVAFVRGINGATSDVFVVSISGGTATRITWDNQDLVGLDWSADGQSVVYATDRAGGYTIWRAPLAAGAPQLIVGGAAKLKHPSVARNNGRVTYESWSYEINLWEAPLVDHLDLEGDLTSSLRPTVQTSDQWNHSPDLSPDESQLAFVSTRSGSAQVWIAGRQGHNSRQLGDFGRAALRAPRFSPDGKQILISAAVNGQSDLYLIDAVSGSHTRLTNDTDDEVAPAWSYDGRSIMFGSRQGGTWQVMRMMIADGSRTALTTGGGYAAQPSADGTRIFFTRLEAPGVWSMAADGPDRKATLLVPNVRAAENVNWRATSTGIYFVGSTADQPVIRRAPLSGGAGVDVAWIGNYSWPGFAVTRDGKVIYAHWDRREANIMALDTSTS